MNTYNTNLHLRDDRTSRFYFSVLKGKAVKRFDATPAGFSSRIARNNNSCNLRCQ